VRWRGSAVRRPRVSTANTSSRRTASWSTPSMATCAAASSRASGSPSSRAAMAATAGAVRAVSAKLGCAARARSTKSRTASYASSEAASASASWAAGGTAERGGCESPPTGHTVSPSTPNASRLVASSVSPAQRRSSRSARTAAPSTTCSQLSSTRRSRRGAPCGPASAAASASASAPGCWSVPDDWRTSSAAATAGTGSAPAGSGASSTHQTPSGNRAAAGGSSVACAAPAAASRARRVLPTPPGPVSVTRRARPSSAPTSARSRARPTKPDSAAGTLCADAPCAGSGGALRVGGWASGAASNATDTSGTRGGVRAPARPDAPRARSPRTLAPGRRALYHAIPRPPGPGGRRRIGAAAPSDRPADAGASLAAQQRRFDAFRAEYNAERPHEARATTRAEHYVPSPRRRTRRTARTPSTRGTLRCAYTSAGTRAGPHRGSDGGHVLARGYVTLEEVDDRRVVRVLRAVLLGRFDARRPAQPRRPQPPQAAPPRLTADSVTDVLGLLALVSCRGPYRRPVAAAVPRL
jgi:hypothetical protein